METDRILVTIHSPRRDELLRVQTRIPRSRPGSENVQSVPSILEIVIHTDHAAFHWLLIIDDASGHLMRWHLLLEQYELEVRYKKGKEYTQSDELSKFHTNGETIPENNDDIPTSSIDEEIHDEDEFVDVLHKEEDLQDFMEPEYTDGDELRQRFKKSTGNLISVETVMGVSDVRPMKLLIDDITEVAHITFQCSRRYELMLTYIYQFSPEFCV